MPMYFIIGIWGGPRTASTPPSSSSSSRWSARCSCWWPSSPLRSPSRTPTAATSRAPSTTSSCALRASPTTCRSWAFLAFFLAFAIKVPMCAVPHLAARRPRRGAHGRLGDPGRRAAQAGRLRLHPLLPAALPRRGAVVRGADRRPVARSPSSTARSWPWSQTDLKKLVAYSSGEPHGLRHPGHLRLPAAGHPGRHAPDGQPRADHGRPLPPRRLDLRAQPRPDIAAMGGLAGATPVLRGGLRVLRARPHRPARPGRASSASSWSSRARSWPGPCMRRSPCW